MKQINHILIALSVASVWNSELIPSAIIGATAPNWMEWVYAKATGRYIAYRATPEIRRYEKIEYRSTKNIRKPYIKHRTTTHVIAYWVLAMEFAVWVWDFHGVLTAFTLGGLSHVLCDSFTVQGVPFWWWSNQRFTLFNVKYYSGAGEYWQRTGENWFTCVVILLCTAYAAYYGELIWR